MGIDRIASYPALFMWGYRRGLYSLRHRAGAVALQSEELRGYFAGRVAGEYGVDLSYFGR